MHSSLRRSDFGDAVRNALRHYARTDLVAGNGLLRTRLLTRSGPDAATPRALKDLIAETAETLSASKRHQKFYLVLDLTYFNPAPNHEAAEAQVWMARRTYRQ